MKAEIYNAIASLNRGYDIALESLKLLQERGVLDAGYAEDHTTLTDELRTGINCMIVNRLETSEHEDWGRLGK